jgi:hypothetical protein
LAASRRPAGLAKPRLTERPSPVPRPGSPVPAFSPLPRAAPPVELDYFKDQIMEQLREQRTAIKALA